MTINGEYGNYMDFMESFGYSQATRYFNDNELGYAFGYSQATRYFIVFNYYEIFVTKSKMQHFIAKKGLA